MTNIRMILKHLRLRGMLGIKQSKINLILRIYFVGTQLCPMSLISPNFAVKSIIFFPIFARDLFPKSRAKGPAFY